MFLKSLAISIIEDSKDKEERMEKIGFDHGTPSGRALVIEINVVEKLVETIKKVNEIVCWINDHEKIMIKDRDWLLARMELFEDSLRELE